MSSRRSPRYEGEAGLHELDPRTIRAAARGDRTSFEEIVRAYQTPIWRFLTRYLGDSTLAEDVTQETFLRVHRHLHRFSFQSKFSTWLFSIARNAAVDAHRRRVRRERLPLLAPAPAPIGTPGPGAEISAAVDELSVKLREALLLVEVLGLTYRETAEVLDIPEGTAKSRVFAARSEMAEFLREDSKAAARGM